MSVCDGFGCHDRMAPYPCSNHKPLEVYLCETCYGTNVVWEPCPHADDRDVVCSKETHKKEGQP